METLILSGKPVPKARPRVVNGHAYTPRETQEYEELVRLCYRRGSGDKRLGPVSVSIVFAYEMPKSWPKKKKAEMDGQPKTTKPDLDNLVKTVLDGLNGEAWEDDAQVVTVASRKVWTSEESKTTVEIW